MEFEVGERALTRELLRLLRARGLFHSLSALAAETGVSECESEGGTELGEEMRQVQALVLQGRWEELLRYLEPLRPSCARFPEAEYIVKKQQYLEALCWQGAFDCPPEMAPWRPVRPRNSGSGGDEPAEEEVDMDQVVAVLKSLEPLCSQQEFNRLCNCLTYSNLTESPDYGQWRMAQGRMDCIQSLNMLLAPCLSDDNPSLSPGTGMPGLLGLMALGLEYCVEQTSVTVKGGNRGRRDFFDALPNRIPVETHVTPQGPAIRPAVPGVLNSLDSLPTLHVVSECPSHVPLAVAPVIAPQTSQLSNQTATVSALDPSSRGVQQNSVDVATKQQQGTTPSSSSRFNRDPPLPQPSGQSIPTASRQEVFKGTNIIANKNNSVPPKPPVSWTVDDSSNAPSRELQHEREVSKEKEPKGQSWNIDFTGSEDRTRTERGAVRKSSPAKPSWSEQSQHNQRLQTDRTTRHDPDDMDEATVMTTGTSVTTATAVTTGSAITSGTGVLSQDTIDRKQFTRQGGNNQSTAQRKVVAPESHITRAEPNSVVFPGWASALDAAADQAVIINPVLLYRDSNPLRSVSLRPTASKVVVSRDGGLEDSLSLNPATTGENITLAVGSNAKSITIVDMTRPFNAISIRHELQGVHRGSIYTSDWSRDGQLLASGSNDKTIRVIRNIPVTGQEGNIQDISCSSLKGHTGTIRCLKFCPFFGSNAPSVLASGGAGDCRLRIWDVQTETCSALAAHQDHIHGISWVNSDVVLSGCDKGSLLAHDTRAASVAWSTNLSPNGICHLGNMCNNLLLSGHTNGEVNVFDIRMRRKLSSHILHSGDVRSVAMWTQNAVPNSTMDVDTGHLFGLTTSFDGQGSVWKLNAQQLCSGSNTSPADGYDVTKVARLVGHTDKILSSVYSHLTHDIITSGADGNVLSWSATNIASGV